MSHMYWTQCDHGGPTDRLSFHFNGKNSQAAAERHDDYAVNVGPNTRLWIYGFELLYCELLLAGMQ